MQKKTSMMSLKNLSRKLLEIFNHLRSSKFLSKVLILLSFVYPIILILLSWSELIKVDWGEFISNIYYVVFIYFLSLFAQGVGWSIVINGDFSHFFSDMEIFYKSILMRRLPGGFWHWVGRSNLYEEVQNKPKKRVGLANFIEWILIFLSGVTLYFFSIEHVYGVGALLVSYVITYFLLKKSSFGSESSALYGLLLLLIYLISWCLGSFIFHTLINDIFQHVLFPFWKSVSVWTITGSISNISFFLPSGLLIRELSLMALMGEYLNNSEAIFLGLVLRVIFLACDIVLSLFGMILFRWLGKGNK